MTKGAIASFMKRHRLAVVATISSSGMPQSALVGIAVTDDLEVIFDTSNEARKYANLKARPEAALVIGWDNEQTLQYEGLAEELRGTDLAPYQERYFEVYPDGRERALWPDIAYFVVRPKWLRYSDFNPPEVTIVEFSL